MQKKKSSQKSKKLAITLSGRDVAILQRYASDNGVTKAVAIKRMVRQFLADFEQRNPMPEVDDNQIGLFDSMQTDIFGNLTKIK